MTRASWMRRLHHQQQMRIRFVQDMPHQRLLHHDRGEDCWKARSNSSNSISLYSHFVRYPLPMATRPRSHGQTLPVNPRPRGDHVVNAVVTVLLNERMPIATWTLGIKRFSITRAVVFSLPRATPRPTMHCMKRH